MVGVNVVLSFLPGNYVGLVSSGMRVFDRPLFFALGGLGGFGNVIFAVATHSGLGSSWGGHCWSGLSFGVGDHLVSSLLSWPLIWGRLQYGVVTFNLPLIWGCGRFGDVTVTVAIISAWCGFGEVTMTVVIPLGVVNAGLSLLQCPLIWTWGQFRDVTVTVAI